MSRVAVGMLLWLLAPAAPGLDLRLDGVTANQGGREMRLNVGGRATFDLDPVARELTAAGTWTATWQPALQMPRFTHKVEDMRVSADGEFSFRSYECVEGTFGALVLGESICGRYRFGANMTDDGGAVDDEVRGPPISLVGWKASVFDWDGKSLVVVLVPVAQSTDSLTLRFSLKPPPR